MHIGLPIPKYFFGFFLLCLWNLIIPVKDWPILPFQDSLHQIKPAEKSFRPMASFGSKYLFIKRLLTPLVQFDAIPENHSLVVIIGYYQLELVRASQIQPKACPKLARSSPEARPKLARSSPEAQPKLTPSY